ncbi:AP2 domain-containing protein [Variovorax saccharolyticus]|uniref:AP2 domain-containing protein n=1 Tax=Variovorax saccharolyticus TaxID=3053516 RepID=UPI0025763B71|nr:AP2 domain-containing protein [Variovorax sp. J31P216]MDM0029139.1 AP2 domain-containing protein [Variovorax sp. J31P216]
MQASVYRVHSADMYGIKRKASGWEVAIMRQGVTRRKSFSDKRHAGEHVALLHAQAWRDEILRTHPPASRVNLANRLRRNNKSGIPGVICRLGPDGEPIAWLAITYLAPDRKLNKFFSVSRFGAAEAKRLAIEERQKQLQQMHGLERVHPAEADLREAPTRPVSANYPAPIARRELLRITNKTGFPGVRFRRTEPSHPGWWIATTYAGNGRNLSKSFSLKVHENDVAKMLAVDERRRQLLQVQQMRQALEVQGRSGTGPVIEREGVFGSCAS